MRQRNSYPKPFKAQVVQECLQPGATISSVAIHHGINANVLRKWLPIYRDQSPATLPAFVPVKTVPRRASEEMVIISLPLGDKSITVKWPAPFQCRRAYPWARWRARWHRCGSSQQVSKECGAGSSAIGGPVNFDGATRVQNLNTDIRRSLRHRLHRHRDKCRLKRHAVLRFHPNPFMDEVCIKAVAEGYAGD